MIWHPPKNGNHLVKVKYTQKSVSYIAELHEKLFLIYCESLKTTDKKSIWEHWENPDWQVDKYVLLLLI